MTKSELASALFEKRNKDIATKTAAERIVDDLFDIVSDAIADDGNFRYPDFGTFEVVKRAEHEGVDPNTKEKIKIPAKNVVKFRPSIALKTKAAGCKSAR